MSLTQLHSDNVQWKKVLKFHQQEIQFFQRYLAGYVKKMTDKDKSDVLDVFNKKLESELIKINSLVDYVNGEEAQALESLSENDFAELKKIEERHIEISREIKGIEQACKIIKEDLYDFFEETSSLH